MKKNLVVFLHHNYFTENDWQVFEVEKFKKISDVIIFEFGELNIKKYKDIFQNRKKNKSIVTVKNLNKWKIELRKQLSDYKNKIAIHQIQPNTKYKYLILKELSRMDIKTLELDIYNLPYNKNYQNSLENLFSKIFNLEFLFKKISFFPLQFFAKLIDKKNSFIITNNKTKISQNQKQNIILGVNREYSLALTKKENLKFKNKKFILFLENMSPYWPGDVKLFPDIIQYKKKIITKT